MCGSGLREQPQGLRQQCARPPPARGDKMRTRHFCSIAVLAAALSAGVALAQSTNGRISFEMPGESVRPAELTQGKAPAGALGEARHGYYYGQCYNYYRWLYDYYFGWQRHFVGTRCY